MVATRYSRKGNRRQDGNAGEKIGAEFAAEEFFQEHPDEREAADQKCDKERNVGVEGREVEGVLQDDMQKLLQQG